LLQAAGAPDAEVLLALAGDRIVGYGVLCRPGPEERWAAMDEVMEIGAIETSRSRRGRGIAGAVLGLIARHPRIEEWAVVVVGYAWSWDLRGCGLDAAAYRAGPHQTDCDVLHCSASHSSRNFELNSSTRASRACFSSGPCALMITFDSNAAASIMTFMMLAAFAVTPSFSRRISALNRSR